MLDYTGCHDVIRMSSCTAKGSFLWCGWLILTLLQPIIKRHFFDVCENAINIGRAWLTVWSWLIIKNRAIRILTHHFRTSWFFMFVVLLNCVVLIALLGAFNLGFCSKSSITCCDVFIVEWKPKSVVRSTRTRKSSLWCTLDFCLDCLTICCTNSLWMALNTEAVFAFLMQAVTSVSDSGREHVSSW